ncbi:MAG: hypothetical protein N2513_00900 [Deltaproteobacteria bacterium]|nr:hypothetical protein [Deltaproteobacteria bacterium]
MRRTICLWLLTTAIFSLFLLQEILAEEKKEISGSAILGIYNQYIFRGYEIGKNGLVLQPSLSLGTHGFSFSLWGNLDTNQRSTKTATFDKEYTKGWNETDLSLSYTYAPKKLSLTVGYTYYSTKYANDTEEIFLSFSYKTLFNPTFSVYRDITSYIGTYMNLGFSHSLSLSNGITMDLSSAFGYFLGESDYWRTYDKATFSYTGRKYRGFHDGMIKVSLSIPLGKVLSIQPSIQYWFPLSGKAKKEYPSGGSIKDSYNPNGPVKYNFVYGALITCSF